MHNCTSGADDAVARAPLNVSWHGTAASVGSRKGWRTRLRHDRLPWRPTQEPPMKRYSQSRTEHQKSERQRRRTLPLQKKYNQISIIEDRRSAISQRHPARRWSSASRVALCEAFFRQESRGSSPPTFVRSWHSPTPAERFPISTRMRRGLLMRTPLEASRRWPSSVRAASTT